MSSMTQRCCPVCQGSGVFTQGLQDSTCHICHGTGRVGEHIRQGDDHMMHAGSIRAVKQVRRRMKDAAR